jgi:hypothetical protein
MSDGIGYSQLRYPDSDQAQRVAAKLLSIGCDHIVVNGSVISPGPGKVITDFTKRRAEKLAGVTPTENFTWERLIPR